MPRQTATTDIALLDRPLWVEDIDSVWEFAAPLIQKALNEAHGEETLESVRASLDARESQLWVWPEGIATTSIQVFPAMRVLRGGQLAGWNFSHWMERLHFVLTHFAKENGCQRIDLAGREGWVKMLKPLGYEKTYTVTSYVIR